MPQTLKFCSSRFTKKSNDIESRQILCNTEEMPHNMYINTTTNVNSNGIVNISFLLNGKDIPSHIRGFSKSPCEATVKNIVNFIKKPYVVSMKASGSYTIIYIDSSGICYYVCKYLNRMFEFGKCKNKKYYNTAYSAEYMNTDKYGRIYTERGLLCKRYILIFDILYSKHYITDVLLDRIKFCKEMLLNITYNKKYFSTIVVKKYYDIENAKENLYKLFHNNYYDTDGLIITPTIGKPNICLRWKPIVTIDVGIEYCSQQRSYILYTYNEYNNKKYLNLFDIKLCNNKKDANNISDFSSYEEFIQIFSINILKKERENPAICNHFIIELEVYIEPFVDNNIIIPVRHRYDKKKPDSFKKIVSIFKASHNHFTSIFGIENSFNLWPVPALKDKGIRYKKKIMKIIKEFIFGSVLDMGSGTAKYIVNLCKHPRINHIMGIEKDELKYIIGKGRLNTKVNKKDRKKIKLIHGDFNIFDTKEQFDTILCINTVQFVADIKILNRLLKINGKIIIFYMNADSIKLETFPECKCLNVNKCYTHRSYNIANYKNYHIINSRYIFHLLCPPFYNNLCYKNIKPLLDTDSKPFHKPDKIAVKLPLNLKAHEENLIYPKEFNHNMLNNGFKNVKSVDINSYFRLSVYEKISEDFYHNKMNLLYNLSISDIAFSIYNFIENRELIVLSCTNKSIYNLCRNEKIKRFSSDKNQKNGFYKRSINDYCYEWDGSMNGLLLDNISNICHSDSSFS